MSGSNDLDRLRTDLTALEVSLRAAETNLVELDDVWNGLSATNPPMTGAAADRLQQIHERIGGLWEHWTALQSVLRRANDAVGASDARALAELLDRESVLITGQRLALAHRTLTGGFRNEARYRPAQLLDDMSTTFAETRDSLAGLATLSRSVAGRVEQLKIEIGEIERGIGAERPDAAELAELQLALLDVDTAASDPVSADAALATAAGKAAALRHSLHERHLQHGGLQDDLATASRSVADLQSRVVRLGETRAQVTRAFVVDASVVDAVEVADRSVRQLASRLAELAARGPADWRRTVADLARWQHERERLDTGLVGAERALVAPAERRAELRGLLDASKAKARERGCGEDAELALLADEALRILRTMPCDLDAASAAVVAHVAGVRAAVTEDAAS